MLILLYILILLSRNCSCPGFSQDRVKFC